MKTVHLNPDSFAKALEVFRDTIPAFQVVRTGYTAKIKLPDGRSYYFGGHGGTKRVFPIAKALQKEVARFDRPAAAGPIKYYRFPKHDPSAPLPCSAWCIDLTAAYCFALLNAGMITKETADALRSLPKADRLRAIGMLAVNKDTFNYRCGKVESIDNERAETAWAFFAACRIVGELMENAAQHPGFLFYWVDGIFFETEAPEVSRYFEARGYPCKTEAITDLRFSTSGRFLFYTKDNERKYLSIPKGKQPSSDWIKQLLETETQNPTT